MEEDDNTTAQPNITRLNARAIVRRSLERFYSKKRTDSKNGAVTTSGATAVSQNQGSVPEDTDKEECKVKQPDKTHDEDSEMNETDNSNKIDSQAKMIHGHRRAFSQGFTIPPPPWERKSVDVNQSQNDTIARRSSTGDLQGLDGSKESDSKSNTLSGEALASAGQEANLEGYSPRLDGKHKGDGKGKKAKFGTKAADLFAKLQSRLSSNRT